MTFSCPRCARLLTLPAAPASHLVQCPGCGTVIDVRGVASAPVSAPVLTADPLASLITKPTDAPRPRLRSRQPPWVALGLVALLVAGVAVLGVLALSKQRADAAARAPAEEALTWAQGFVRQNLPQEVQVEFPPGRARVSATTDGAWVVDSEVDFRGQPPWKGVQTWKAQIRKSDQDEWRLERLEIGGEVLASAVVRQTAQQTSAATDVGEEDSEFEFKFPTPAGISVRSAEEDYYGNQTPAWAVEQLKAEVEAAVSERNTLLVWLIDRSTSAASFRQQVLDGLPSLFAAGSAVAEDRQLLSAALSFGSDVQPLIAEPTSDSAAVAQAIASVAPDESGEEVVFAAVREGLRRGAEWAKPHAAQTLIVVVTDEAGDDPAELEPAIVDLRAQAVAVFVIGGRAPLGREAVTSNNPEVMAFGQAGRKATFRQGPESWASEQIQLSFGVGGFGGEDTDLIDSGFGPCALTRLARESNGAFYACRMGGDSGGFGASDGFVHFFKPQVMRKYQPDYVSQAEYEKLLAENKARMALHRAARLPRAEAMRGVRLDFPKVDEASFKGMLDNAQKVAATAEPRIDDLYQALKSGESDRPKLTGLRWQASFDLCMGRILAAKARTEGYNNMLAMLKSAPTFKDPANNTFVLMPSEELAAGSASAKYLTQSRMYLERVIKEHPETPWAYLAKRELETPLGWEWSERP